MKNLTHILVIAVFAAALSPSAWSIENTAIRNPAGISTVPPSSFGGGLYRSPNPIDSSANRTVTGNVRGGRYFRAPIGYGSTSRFEAPLGSTSLDSFLRDSASFRNYGTYSGKYDTQQPYYSPSQTVPTARPGRSGVFKPIDSRIDDRAPGVFGLRDLQKKPTLTGQDAAISRLGTQRVPLTSEEIGRLTTGLARVSPRNETMTSDYYRTQIERLRLDMMNLRMKAGELTTTDTARTGTLTKEELLKLLTEPGADQTESLLRGKGRPGTPESLWQIGTTQPPKTGLTVSEQKRPEGMSTVDEILSLAKSEQDPLQDLMQDQTQSQMVPKPEEIGVPTKADLERIREQIANLQQRITRLRTVESLIVDAEKTRLSKVDIPGEADETKDETSSKALLSTVVPDPMARVSVPQAVDQGTGATTEQGVSEATSIVEQLNKLSAAEIAAKAKKYMGPHKTIESHSKARFRINMANAQAYLKQGQYYQAASAFANASMYDSKNPDAYAGKSLALFAAGEYVSSALFLSRAIKASDQYIYSDVDLAAMLGNKVKMDRRTEDVEDWLERSLSPQLEFLLSYIYYRTGKLRLAKEAVDSAYKQMPEAEAVQIVRKAIYDKLGSKLPKSK